MDKEEGKKPEQVLWLEEQLGFELEEVDEERKITSSTFFKRKVYLLDENKRLIGLRIDRCSLSNISFLESLIDINVLNLNHNPITDISSLIYLRNLTTLHIIYNEIEDYSVFSKIVSLTSLNVSYNKIFDISFLSNLTNLVHLDISMTRVSDISTVSTLRNLTSLNLNFNPVSNIHPLKNLKNITSIQIWGSLISNIAPLLNLRKLEELHLWKNNISDKKQIKKLIRNKNLKYLYLGGNPIPYLPFELLGNESDFVNCLPHLRNYYQNQDFVPNKEIKVVILGNGMVGKSTLLNRFLSPDGKWEDIKIAISDRTEGIVIKENIDFELEDDKQIKLNIWDFGGQEVYHGTHRLFLNKDAVYIIVWALETDEQENEIRQDLNYWLDYAQDLAIDSPMILVHSQCEKASIKDRKEIDKQVDISENQKYQENIIEHYLPFSAKEKIGIEELNEAIKKAIKTKLSARVETEIPEKWSLLRDDLRKLRENETNKTNEISYQEYIDRCKKREIEQSEAETVLLFLHRTGFLYYDEKLSKNIILNQTWAIEAIYEALKPSGLVKDKNGKISSERLVKLWQEKGYSENEAKTFIDFMVSSEICFCKEQQDYRSLENPTFIVPHYLEEPNPLLVEWDKPNSFYMIYKPAFFHKGIAERFLSRLGRLSGQNALWKDGILLKSDIFSSKALITFDKCKADEKQKEIFIRSENYELLEAILNELNKILDEGSQTKPSEKVTFFYSLDGEEFVSEEDLTKQIKDDNYESNIRTLNDKLLKVKDFAEKYRLGKAQKTVSKESDFEKDGKQNETLLMKEANNKKNPREINPFVAAALKALENANYADYFEEMDNVEIPIESKAIYQELKMKMITGNAPFNFEQSLRLFAKEINKKLE